MWFGSAGREGDRGFIGGFFAVDEDLHGLGQPEWVSIEVVMDNGAAESVAPSDMAPWVPIQESREDGLRAAEATFQVADVTRPLCSNARVCDQGNTVVFTSA